MLDKAAGFPEAFSNFARDVSREAQLKPYWKTPPPTPAAPPSMLRRAGVAVGQGVGGVLTAPARFATGMVGRGAREGAVRLLGAAARSPVATLMGVATTPMLAAGTIGGMRQSMGQALHAGDAVASNFIKLSAVEGTLSNLSTPRMVKVAARTAHLAGKKQALTAVDEAARAAEALKTHLARTPPSLRGMQEGAVHFDQFLQTPLGRGLSSAARAGAKAGLMGAGIVGLGALGAGTAVGLQLGQRGLTHLADRALRGNPDQQFEAMLRVDPGLRKEPLARRYFDVVNRASHYVSSEPAVVAGAVRSMVETSRDDGKASDVTAKLREVLSVEKERQSSRYPVKLHDDKPGSGLGGSILSGLV